MNAHLSVLAENLIPVLADVLVVVLPVLAVWALVQFKKKTGLQISESMEQKLQATLRTAVARAELWALNKAKTEGTLPAGAQKLDKALEFVNSELERLKLKKLGEEKLKELVEGALAVRKGN